MNGWWILLAIVIGAAIVSCVEAWAGREVCFVRDLATERRFIITTFGQGVAIAPNDPVTTSDDDDDFPADSPSQLAAEPTRTDSRIFERR